MREIQVNFLKDNKVAPAPAPQSLHPFRPDNGNEINRGIAPSRYAAVTYIQIAPFQNLLLVKPSHFVRLMNCRRFFL